MHYGEPLISVIIPVYNVEPYLARCLDSVLSQTHTNLEVLIVDDGSTDNSGLICDEISKKDGRVRVSHKASGGVSSARNAGMDAARGDWVAFVDADDWIEPDMLEKLLRAASENGAQMAGCGYVQYRPGGNRVKVTCPELDGFVRSADILEYYIRENDFVRVWSLIYSRDMLESDGAGSKIRFNKELLLREDTPFVVEAMLVAGSFAYVPEALYHYCWREGSLVNAPFIPQYQSLVGAWQYMARTLAPVSGSLMWYARLRAADIAVDFIVTSMRTGNPGLLPKIKKSARRHMTYYLLRSGRSPAEKLRHFLYAFFPKPTNRIYTSLKARAKAPEGIAE